jgi:hypothetical protein
MFKVSGQPFFSIKEQIRNHSSPINQSIHQSIHQSINPSINQSIHPSIHPSIFFYYCNSKTFFPGISHSPLGVQAFSAAVKALSGAQVEVAEEPVVF